MSKRTNKYGMTYFEQDDITSASYEMQRWETLDAQLNALFSIMGNGVLSGWSIEPIQDGGLACSIFPGSGHVGFVAVQSTSTKTLNLNPSSTNYIYAQLTTDSYWTKSVSFVSFLDQLSLEVDKNLYLGSVITDANEILSVDTSGRTELGFLAIINAEVAKHKHNGAVGNPDPIDLSKDVQGVLNQNNLPDLDASLIQSGTIDINRLPQIDHISQLTNNGILTHAQLDSYIETLSLEDQSLMGEVSTVNLLQLILALKHVYPDIDEFLVNEIAFIPGVSPNDYIDTVNTTAIVDTRTYAEGGQHTITGVPTEHFKSYTKKWDKNADFNDQNLYNTIVIGDSVVLNTSANELSIDEFNNISQWSTSTHDLSSIGSSFQLDNTNYVSAPSSAKLTIGTESVEVQLLLKKTFGAQDWSGYDFLHFYLYTTNVRHGDLFFYISDSVRGIQKSNIKVLSRNQLTINEDTLINGWQEVVVDLRPFVKTKIDTMGFYVSTKDGWDTSKGFDLNIDSFRLTAGNIYNTDGFIRLIYGNSIYKNFSTLRWDALYPSDDLSDGVDLRARTRVANDLIDLSTSTWSSYFSVSGSEIELPTESLYKYIEIEMYFTASTSLKRSVTLNSLYLDHYIVDVENSFEFATQEDWESGTLFNTDTDSNPGSISIKSYEDFGDVTYGSSGKLSVLDNLLNVKYDISGSMLPVSVYQAINSMQSGFGMITGVARGADGHIWLSDIDNDRVVEIDRNGYMIRGFYGSYLKDPLTTDYEKGILSTKQYVNVLNAVLNPNTNILYVVLDKILVSINDSPYMYLKAGSQRIDLSTVEKTIVNDNIVAYSIEGADATLLGAISNDQLPVISIVNPCANSIETNSVTIKFLTQNYDMTYGVQATIDSEPSTVIYDSYITYSGLSNGTHTVSFVLRDSMGALLTSDGSTATVSFAVLSNYQLPHIKITNPLPNQIYSSNVANVDFAVINFPILSNGQHLMYQVDSQVPEDHYSSDPIVLNDLDAGIHNVTIWMVDEKGGPLVYDFSSVNVDFIVGANYSSLIKLYSSNGIDLQKITKIDVVDIANIKYIPLYAPIDIQFLLPDSYRSEPTILISKLDLNKTIELDMNGVNLMENNLATFATSKEQAKNILGSSEKIGKNELLIADSINKRAIVVNAETNEIIWEYESDRYVVDFHLNKQDERSISVYDGSVSSGLTYLKQGMELIWKNESSIPVSIYSGYTTYDLFNLNPNLNLYGNIFKSQVLQTGESYSFKFNNEGEYSWFVYPSIITGEIKVTERRLSVQDEYYILESDGLDSPFSSRLIKVDSWGHVVFEWGSGFLVKPRDVRIMLNNKVIIST